MIVMRINLSTLFNDPIESQTYVRSRGFICFVRNAIRKIVR